MRGALLNRAELVLKGLFERLYDLASSQTLQTERFFTEVLASLLQSDGSLCDGLMRQVLQLKDTQSGFDIEAHQQIGSYEVDLVASNEKTIVIFENKIDSPAGRDQLCNYYRTLVRYRGARTAYLVFVTLDRSNKQDSREIAKVQKLERNGAKNGGIQFIHIHWGFVWRVLNGWREPVLGSEARPALLMHVLEYMESMGMATFDTFGPDDYWAWPRFKTLYHKIEKILKDAELLEHLSKRYDTRLADERKSGWYGLYLSDKKGNSRIWLGFGCEEEEPEVSIYFMVKDVYISNKTKLERMAKSSEMDYSDNGKWISLSKPLVEVAPPSRTPEKQRERIMDFFRGRLDYVHDSGIMKR